MVLLQIPDHASQNRIVWSSDRRISVLGHSGRVRDVPLTTSSHQDDAHGALESCS